MMEEKYRVCDIMVCALARLIPDGSKVFHGVSSHMPMIALLLAKALHAPGAVHLNIPGGTDPDPVRFKSIPAQVRSFWSEPQLIFL